MNYKRYLRDVRKYTEIKVDEARALRIKKV